MGAPAAPAEAQLPPQGPPPPPPPLPEYQQTWAAPPAAPVCPRCYAPLYWGQTKCGNCGLETHAPSSTRNLLAIVAGLVVVAVLVGTGLLVFVAVRGGGAGASPSESPTAIASAAPSAAGSPSPTRVQPATIRWFVGLGSGSLPNQIDAQRAFVSSYNSYNTDGITINLEIVPEADAYAVLKREIAAGNAPDIIGPVGVKSRNGFEGVFLDLTSEITKNNYDLSQFPDALVKFFRQGGEGQVGLPYLIYPGYIWYNKDAFTKAGLPGLPTKVGDTYQGKTWDWNTLTDVAAQLTLDSSGRRSTDSGFDKTKIVKYGMDFQWCDARRIASLFGGGSFVAEDGKTAQIPAVWSEAFNWYYQAVWSKHIVPSGVAESSNLLAEGNSQASGNVAMNAGWAWSIGMIWDSKTNTAKMKSWDIGVVPSWQGSTSSPLDADTFTITKASKNPDAAFKAMVAIMADTTLMNVYGGIPAKASAATAWTASMDATLAPIFPGIKVTWSVLDEMMKYPTVPSHEANMPAFTRSGDDIDVFLKKLQNKEGLDVSAELTKLRQTLQADFDSASSL
jgi:multiple sugar transport system substrate-binding protein